MGKRRFLIAFSFAGEKRDFVSQVAAILASCFGEPHILYDKYHEAEFAEWKLGLNLPDLYRDDRAHHLSLGEGPRAGRRWRALARHVHPAGVP